MLPNLFLMLLMLRYAQTSLWGSFFFISVISSKTSSDKPDVDVALVFSDSDAERLSSPDTLGAFDSSPVNDGS